MPKLRRGTNFHFEPEWMGCAMIHGIPIQVERLLIGSKRAIRFGNGPILLSPAMYDLVAHAADHAELESLLAQIPLLNLPAMPVMFEPLPMTTQLGENGTA